MARTKDPGVAVADDVVKRLYNDYDFVVEESQPVFVLQKDTIKAFLHEKAGVIAAEARCLAYLGIELSIFAALATATFQDFWVFKGPTVQGTFVAFSIIFGVLVAREGWRWFCGGRTATPEKLTDELGARGAKITPKKKNETG